MKKINLTYNEKGYISNTYDDGEFYIAQQENDSVSISATFPGMLKGSVKAYVEFPGGGDIIECENLTVNNHTAAATLSSDHLRYHYLLVGFEVDTGTKQIRFEPVTLEVDRFVNPSGSVSPSPYTVTVKIGSVTELEPGEAPTVNNVGTEKNIVLDFGIPKGEKGDKGDKGDSGEPFKYEDFTPEQLNDLRGPQGIQGPKGDRGEQGVKGDKGDKGDRGERGADGKDGINGADGKDGYTPQKGVDYFTAQDIKSLGIDDKVDKVDGKGLSSNDFTTALKNKLDGIEPNATSSPEVITIKFEKDGKGEGWESWQNKTFFNQYRHGLYYITGWYIYSGGGDVTESVILLCTSNEDGGEHIHRLLITNNGDVYKNYQYPEGFEYEDNNVWTKISISQSNLDKAIGDVETSLENIIAKYGLGGDGV